MVNGCVIGIVLDNVDPDKMHRILVQHPVEGEEAPSSSWCRIATSMAGKDRGLVMIPDKGTEVVMGFAYRTMTPYVLGGVYNGAADKPEPYHNDDKKNNLRVFWSRNDHLLIFDDTCCAEKVSLGAKAPTRLDVKSGPIWHILDAKEKIITTFVEKDWITEAKEKISVKCKDLKIEASNNVEVEGGQTVVLCAQSMTMDANTADYSATAVAVNGGSPLEL
jgi:uncharacterized protein involved in type VI secretion and phage assembly